VVIEAAWAWMARQRVRQLAKRREVPAAKWRGASAPDLRRKAAACRPRPRRAAIV